MNFEYTVDPNANEPIMLINKHIGIDADGVVGIMGSQFQAELLALDAMGKDRIKVYINTPGGSVREGFNIYSAILASKAKVDTYCMGLCASIGMPIFQAGRTRYMSDFGALMVHNPYYSSNPLLQDEMSDVMRNSISTMISERTGQLDWETKMAMDVETWYTPKQDSKGNFEHSQMWDEVVSSSSKNKPRLVKSNVIASYERFNSYVNQLIINKPVMDLKEVYNLLDLSEGSSEKAISKAITNLVNKKDLEIKQVNETYNALVIDNEAKVKALNEAVNLCDDLTKRLEEVKNEAVNTKVLSTLEKYKNVVNESNKDFWDKSLRSDFEGAENALKAMPNIVNGVNIVVKNVDANAPLSDEDRIREMRNSLAKEHQAKLKNK